MPDDLYQFTVNRSDGTPWQLWELHGQVVLFVALHAPAEPTVQTEGVERLFSMFADKGLVVVGVPMVGPTSIGSGYGVTFPLAAPMRMDDSSPLFAWLNSTVSTGDVGTARVTGYTKFLIGRDGRASARFGPSADAKALIAAVQAELATPVPPAPPKPEPKPPHPAPSLPAPAAIDPPAPAIAGHLPVPTAPHRPDDDIIDAELVDEELVELQTQISVEIVATELATDAESASMGADLMDFSDELRGIETDAQLLTEHHRDNPPG